FAHSLGVTIAHDFLFGLFNTEHAPHFVTQKQGSAKATSWFRAWRKKAQAGELKLGGFACAASQLPLMVMRKQALVTRLRNSQGIDPRDIGVLATGGIQWKIFYDIDDVLGFASRGLYSPNNAIMDIQVNCGGTPQDAHGGYWTN